MATQTVQLKHVNWLAVILLYSVALHFHTLPTLLLLICAINIFVTLLRYRLSWPPVNPWLKHAWSFLCFGSVLFSYQHWLDTAPIIGILAVTYTLKFFELRLWRDVILLSFLSYFVVSLSFLHQLDMLFATWVVIGYILITISILSYHYVPTIIALKKSLVLLLQAAPIMLILFVIFPRITPFWLINLGGQQAKTGLSDTISPSAIVKLSRSSELAFRVSFEGDIPFSSQRYWRGLVYSDYDGKTWFANKHDKQPRQTRWQWEPAMDWERSSVVFGTPTRYTMIMEPTQQKWLYPLDLPSALDPKTGLTPDFTVVHRAPLQRRLQFDFTSNTEYELGSTLSDADRQRNLALPDGINPKSRALAQQWLDNKLDVNRIIQSILRMYHDDFTYTLQPGAFGEHDIDEFLFDRRAGFCGHFASSMVFLLRASGIPARVIGGYLGGEKNAVGDHLLVYQYDAHAWIEVWLDGLGWKRIDPTSAVSPARIELGLADALPNERYLLIDSPFSHLNYRNQPWLHFAQQWWDNVNYRWNIWVLGFDERQQSALLQKFFGMRSFMHGMLMVAFVFVCVLLLYLTLLLFQRKRPYRPQSIATRRYLRLCRVLGKRYNIRRHLWESPRSYARRLVDAQPALAMRVYRATVAYERLEYEGDVVSKRLERRLLAVI